MRLVLATLFAFLVSLPIGGCGGDDEEQYANLQDCVVDHTEVEMLSEPHAITTCLLNHLEIDFDDVQECVDYVTDNGGYPDSRDEACEDYIAEKNA